MRRGFGARDTVEPRMSGGHVLVIEDDEWVARLLAVGLREAGHRVTLCAGGASGIAAVHREAPDCVVCDVELGDVDGYAIGRSMRQAGGRIAGTPLVYLCAGDEDADTKVEALRSGGDAFLSKPFRIDEVALTVTALIRLAERNRGLVVDADGRVSPAPPAPSSRPPPPEVPDGVLEGDLAKVSVATVLTVLEMEKHTGHLEMSNAGQVAKLHIGSGNVDGAQLGDDTSAEPIAVLRTVLTWTGGRFTFVPTKKPERKMTGRATIGALLMEAARLEDEHRAGLGEGRRSSLPPRSARRGEVARGTDSSRAPHDSVRASDSARLSDALNLAFPSSPSEAPVEAPPPPAPPSPALPSPVARPIAAPLAVPLATAPSPSAAALRPAGSTAAAAPPRVGAVPRPRTGGPAAPPADGAVEGARATPIPGAVALRPPPAAAPRGPAPTPTPARVAVPAPAPSASRPSLASASLLDDSWGDDEEPPLSLAPSELEPMRRGPPPVPPPRPTTAPTATEVEAAKQKVLGAAGAPAPAPGQVGDKR
jgi:DNA-binding response OmpR family regulator